MGIGRRLIVAFVVLFAVGSALAEGVERKRYLVGTESLDWEVDLPLRTERERSFHRFRHVRGFSAMLTEAEAAALALRPGIRFVEPDQERRLVDTRPAVRPWTPTPSEDTQEIPYGIAATNANQVWPLTRGAGVKVAVIDTGIQTSHPDLAARFMGGWDFENNDSDPEDDNGHGTHVSGTIGATNNEFGVVGVAPEVEIYALKILDAGGGGSTFNLLRAVEWAIDPDDDGDTSDHMDVINMSLGGGGFSALEKEAFDQALELGIISVAATGNDYPSKATIDYPARYTSVIAVGAIDSFMNVASFSQRGAEMELVGAGVGVLSTVYLGQAYLVGIDGQDAIIGQPMEYAPLLDEVNGTIVSCGVGNPEDFPSGVSGNIALIERGELSFKDKSENAKSAGAVAALIFNNTPGSFLGTLCSSDNPSLCVVPNVPFDPILTVSISQEDGQLLETLEGDNATLTLGSASGYGLNQGTSMATPHVTGVAALLRALVPGASASAIRAAMQSAAVDLGTPGPDSVYGYGMVDAYGAAKILAPWLFGGETPVRRRGIRRPGGGS